jgi:hypothetical protein
LLYSSALRFIFLQTHAGKEKGGKPYRKPYPLPYDIRNPYRNLKTDTSNSQYYAQKPNKIVYVQEFGFRALDVSRITTKVWP